MKKIIVFITLFLAIILSFLPKALCEEVFKITSANFDTANSIIVLTAKDTYSTESIMKDIKLVKLENPKRAYFDIDSSILTIPKQDWTLNTGGIKQVKINQFTTNPNIVRCVLYFSDDYNVNNLKFYKIKNNIIIKIKNNQYSNDYYQLTYRDEHASSSDFYEALTVTSPIIEPTNPPNVVEQIQQAFNTATSTQSTQNYPKMEKKSLKLNTQFYLKDISVKPYGILINGFGAATIEKPMILQNPTRIVYDIPNTLTSQTIRNKEFKINETETAKIGQFEMNKARIVITTNNVNDYIPVFSSDNQSLLLANSKKIDKSSLFSNVSDIIAYNKEKLNDQTNTMILSFNHPIVHGIERKNNCLNIYLYNVSKFSEELFNSTFANSVFSNAKISLMPQIGMTLSIPLENDSLVNTYLGADDKTLKIKVKGVKKVVKQPAIANKQKGGSKKIVIDAGHGGSDYGALRGSINEKDITLDVAKRVKTLLAKQGYTVVMTRETDKYLSLQERCDITEASQPDIFISIHVNSSVKPEITGVETHYYHQESLALAQTVHAAIASNIKSNNRGLFKSKFYVINHTTVPAILCEIGFISNDKERDELNSEKRKQDTAKSIQEGVNNYFKQYP